MNPTDPDTSDATASVAEAFATFLGFVAKRVDDGSDNEVWIGYESLHPLTWVPAQVTRGLA